MGVRLYPRTEDPKILEQLAEVPKGTMAKLNGMKSRLICTRKGVRYYHVPGQSQLVAVKDYFDYDSMLDKELDRIFSDDLVHRLHSFVMNGWGKLSYTATKYLESLGHVDESGHLEPCGHLDDPAQIADLLVHQDLLVSAGGAIACSKPVRQVLDDHYNWVPAAQLGGVQWC